MSHPIMSVYPGAFLDRPLMLLIHRPEKNMNPFNKVSKYPALIVIRSKWHDGPQYGPVFPKHWKYLPFEGIALRL